MSKYNFDKGNSEFGETIKLDGLNQKVREERSSGGKGGNGGGRKRRRILVKPLLTDSLCVPS